MRVFDHPLVRLVIGLVGGAMAGVVLASSGLPLEISVPLSSIALGAAGWLTGSARARE